MDEITAFIIIKNLITMIISFIITITIYASKGVKLPYQNHLGNQEELERQGNDGDDDDDDDEEEGDDGDDDYCDDDDDDDTDDDDEMT
ncbi:hypothetical protein ElyMa_002229800 [Elysia marginata]|uniref:Uncharacterized protein n=1 Tax=Elysia marginata TaxID=1093978 RepID=A0AAV4FUW1_9GAST|nr:hypothetical protein ElyMa_002229800 [Elysia marginata]